MTSDSNDLERVLRENLKLRGELAVEVAKSKDNSRQRVSRDFHRLGIIIALMAGAVSLVLTAHDAITVRLWERAALSTRADVLHFDQEEESAAARTGESESRS
jgi:hypothetical protein